MVYVTRYFFDTSFGLCAFLGFLNFCGWEVPGKNGYCWLVKHEHAIELKHQTQALVGATRLEAADKIAVYRVKSSFSSLF